MYYGGRTFEASDRIFPTFILEYMPSGLIGLILAAILAATMSTHSGAINSLAAATIDAGGAPRSAKISYPAGRAAKCRFQHN